MSSIRPWKRGTEAQRAANNTVPLGGEIGVDTDTGRIVVSDGVTSWAGLSPAIRVTELNAFAASVSGTYVPQLGNALLTGSVGETAPVITIQSPWGIRSDGSAYFDPNGAAPGEAAVPVVNLDGSISLVSPIGAVAA